MGTLVEGRGLDHVMESLTIVLGHTRQIRDVIDLGQTVAVDDVQVNL